MSFVHPDLEIKEKVSVKILETESTRYIIEPPGQEGVKFLKSTGV